MKSEAEIMAQIVILKHIIQIAKEEGNDVSAETYTLLAFLWVLKELD